MIDAILELQKPIMLFFQSIRVPAGDIFAKAVTYCGDAPVAILVLLLIYWCVDKRMGFAFGGTLLNEYSESHIPCSSTMGPIPR